MGKKSREFNLGALDPHKLYNILVDLLSDATINRRLNYRLRMRLKSHSITSEEPFHAEVHALQGSWFEYKQEVTCTINQEGEKTTLKIQSAPRYRKQAFDAYIHKQNIEKLYGELQFRLNTPGKPKLNRVIQSGEVLVQRLYPIEYQNVDFVCSITNSRALLSRDLLVFAEIKPKRIRKMTLGKEKNKRGHPLIYMGAIFAGLFTIMLIPFYISALSILISLPFIILSNILIVVGILISYDRFALIETTNTAFKLYAKGNILTRLIQLLGGMKTGAVPSITTPSLDFASSSEELSLPNAATPLEKFCPFCGMKNAPDSAFCEACGAAI